MSLPPLLYYLTITAPRNTTAPVQDFRIVQRHSKDCKPVDSGVFDGFSGSCRRIFLHPQRLEERIQCSTGNPAIYCSGLRLPRKIQGFVCVPGMLKTLPQASARGCNFKPIGWLNERHFCNAALKWAAGAMGSRPVLSGRATKREYAGKRRRLQESEPTVLRPSLSSGNIYQPAPGHDRRGQDPPGQGHDATACLVLPAALAGPARAGTRWDRNPLENNFRTVSTGCGSDRPGPPSLWRKTTDHPADGSTAFSSNSPTSWTFILLPTPILPIASFSIRIQ